VKLEFCLKQKKKPLQPNFFFAELRTFFLPLCLINQTIGLMQQLATTKPENVRQILAEMSNKYGHIRSYPQG